MWPEAHITFTQMDEFFIMMKIETEHSLATIVLPVNTILSSISEIFENQMQKKYLKAKIDVYTRDFPELLNTNMSDRNMSIEEKEIYNTYTKACEEYYNLKHKVIKI